MTRWSRFVDRVRTNGCMAVSIGELRKVLGNPSPGMFITGKMHQCMRQKEIAIASNYTSLSNKERDAGPSLKVLLYDARRDSAMAKLFRALDAVRSGEVPLDNVPGYEMPLRSAMGLFSSLPE
jgi:hypothetical protein